MKIVDLKTLMQLARIIAMLSLLKAGILCAGLEQSLQTLRSQDMRPHFETVTGRQLLFVEGLPFFVLAAELPWHQSHYGRYRETMGDWDYLYPAARKMHLNTLKVPVKWSQIEPEKGVFDFAYVDHVKALADANGLKLILGWFGHYASGSSGNIYSNLDNYLFAPMDIVEDEKTYPRAVDADGKSYHAIISYDCDAVIEREAAAFRAFMRHIREIDARSRTVIMIQVENEISVFNSTAARNPKMWRDHSPRSNELFEAGGYTDDLKYSAERLASGWLRRVTEAGAQEYALPFYMDFVGGELAGMVGGEPGEDVATYLKLCPRTAFVSMNLYSGSAREADLRRRIEPYRVERNIVAISETNSDRSAVAPRLAFLAIGDYAAPLFSPWAFNISWPTRGEPYVLKDGTLANGAFDLMRAYTGVERAAAPIALCAGTEKLKVLLDGEIRETEVAGAKVGVVYDPGGQLMILHPEPDEFLVIGWKSSVTLETPMAKWPTLKKLRVEAGRWEGLRWSPAPDPVYYAVQGERAVRIRLFEEPLVIRVFAK
jgi:Beta-galactosidase